VGLPSPSALGGKNNLRPEAILTSPSVVCLVAKPKRQSVT